MKIRFSCTCGKKFEAIDTLAGQTIRCRSCQQPIQVPFVDQLSVALPDASHGETAPDVDTPFLPSSSSHLQGPAYTQKHVKYSAKAEKLKAEHLRNEKGQGFSAANPGLLSPSLFKYYRHFPHRIIWRIGLLLVFAGLSFLHWSAIPFALIMAFLVFKHVRDMRSNFISGCICPARILSIDPPLVAVYTDLSMGVNSCKVIRLFEQPLHRLPPEFAKTGRTSTICYFFGMYPGFSEHWFTVLPTMPHFVTDDRVELDRIINSIPDEDWHELDSGLRQLPRNAEQRAYRIIRNEHQPRLAFSSQAELVGLARKFLAEANGKFGPEISDADLAKVNQGLSQPLNRSQVVAMCTGFGSGVVITLGGIVYFFNDEKKPPVCIAWNEIKVAYGNFKQTEFIRIDNQRQMVSNDCGMQTMVQMEKFINAAVGLGPDD